MLRKAIILVIILCGSFVASLSVRAASEGAHTVYFINKNKEVSVTASQVKVHVWSNEDGKDIPLNEWESNEITFAEGLYYRTSDGKFYEVFTYKFDNKPEWTHDPTGIIFHYNVNGNVQTQDLDFNEGALYSLTGNKKGEIENKEPQFQRSYTLYFADAQGWGIDNLTVGSDSGSIKFLSAEATGLLYSCGDKHVPVYRMKIIGDPEDNMIFKNLTTGASFNSTLVESGLYIGGKDQADTDWEPIFKVYFADTAHWNSGDGKVLVHAWGTSGDLNSWEHNEAMTPTGKFYKIDDIYCEVMEYSFRYDEGTMGNILFHSSLYNRLTGDLEYVDGALYYFNGQKGTPDPFIDFTFMDEKPVMPATIYLNLGANQIVQKLWSEPCAHLTTSGLTDVPTRDSEDYEAEKMVEVSRGLYKIDVEDISSYNDVVFYYYGQYQTAVANVFPASKSPSFDPTVWASFVYDIGIDCAHQSYITPARFEELSKQAHSRIFIVGNEMINPTYPGNTYYSEPVDQDEGVFFRKFEMPSDMSAGAAFEFKLSWIDVKGEFDRLNVADEYVFDFQRGWASFNLGIIGCDTKDTQDWIDEFMYVPGGGASRQIRIKKNLSMGYNDYVQYQWRVEADESTGIEKGMPYWLVVDTHNDCHSVTLLDFDPDPKIVDKGVETLVETPGYENARLIHDGFTLNASQADGAVWFDKMNVLSYQLTANTPGDESLAGDFDATHTLYIGGVASKSHTGLPEVVRLKYLRPGETFHTAVRTRYTDRETSISFCSHFSDINITPNVEPASPAASVYDHILTIGKANPDNWNNPWFDAVATLNFIKPETELIYYPDYSVKSLSPRAVESGRLALETETHLREYPRFGFSDHIPWTGGEADAYTESNNWAKLAMDKDNRHLPLIVKSVIDHIILPAEIVNVEAEVSAVYPFLVAPAPVVETVVTPVAKRRMADDGESIDVDGPDYTGYEVHAVRRAAPTLSLEYSRETIVSAPQPSIPDTSEEAEYYDVTGRRVLKPCSPGIYIERKGSSSRKITL